jgi:hypothetical protein
MLKLNFVLAKGGRKRLPPVRATLFAPHGQRPPAIPTAQDKNKLPGPGNNSLLGWPKEEPGQPRQKVDLIGSKPTLCR